jgi:hypothetical protein
MAADDDGAVTEWQTFTAHPRSRVPVGADSRASRKPANPGRLATEPASAGASRPRSRE